MAGARYRHVAHLRRCDAPTHRWVNGRIAAFRGLRGCGVRLGAALSALFAGLMVTGRGAHMLSLNAAMRKRLGKDLGDEVAVRLRRRLR